jgi:tRNA dimethylallyltransferase
MDIGTAKPDRDVLEKYPHHMIDIVDPDTPYDAADFGVQGLKAIKDIVKRGRIPILSGGAGLYFKSILEGFFEGPKADKTIRLKWVNMAKEKGNLFVYGHLRSMDPESAALIHPNNLKRIIRALEIVELTGEKMSDLKKMQKKQLVKIRDTIFINPERKELYEKIDKRTESMFQKGLINETRELLRRFSQDIIPMKSIGYSETIDYLSGKTSKKEAIELVKKNTRNYAKRQITWFCNQRMGNLKIK